MTIQINNKIEIQEPKGGGVPINNQDLDITQNGTYTADEGYTGLGTVDVDVPRGGIQTNVVIAPTITTTLGSIITTVTEGE